MNPLTRKCPRLGLVAAIVAISTAGTPLLTQAQPAALEQVIVTATNRSAGLQDVPFTVTTFSAEVIPFDGFHF
jgi:outer membrane receptor protein involved in Fe transport